MRACSVWQVLRCCRSPAFSEHEVSCVGYMAQSAPDAVKDICFVIDKQNSRFHCGSALYARSHRRNVTNLSQLQRIPVWGDRVVFINGDYRITK